MEEVVNEPTEEVASTSEQPAEPPVDNSDGTLLGKSEEQEGKITESASIKDTDEKYEFDARLYTEDGKFNKDGAKEFLGELKEKEEKYEKRILDLRRKVSDGKAPDTKDAYFQDWAPASEKYMKYFDKDTPPETKEAIQSITDKLSEKYHESALTQRQADDMSNTTLEILEDLGLLDTKSKEEKYIERQEWIEGQKSQLGANADMIIRTTKNWVENTPMFDAKSKNTMIELMESIGAPVINVLHQIKEGAGGEIPTNVASLGGLKNDLELYEEYMKPETSDARRQQIIKDRKMAGRTTRLSEIPNHI